MAKHFFPRARPQAGETVFYATINRKVKQNIFPLFFKGLVVLQQTYLGLGSHQTF